MVAHCFKRVLVMEIKTLKRLSFFVLTVAILGVPGVCGGYEVPQFTDVTVHDPDVVKVGHIYYVFGSHLASAKSTDLIKWEQISADLQPGSTGNRLVPDIFEEFREVFELIGTKDTWAKTVIMLNGKYYMYFSVSTWGSSKSAIALATSENIEGPYRYEGIVLTSGFEETYDPLIHPNAIDPHVFWDKENRLWMVYGSYFGGIYILEMDPETGLPCEQGYGKRLAGGFHAPMEGPYILYSPHTDYYYLFLSFGTLSYSGGYNIRVARSKEADGPYYDSMGNDMRGARGNALDSYGTKIVGNFRFTESGIGYVSPGHNSAYYDSELDKYFVFFHTRFPRMGEVHNLRVHQMFFNYEGWPIMTPHRYGGETLESYSEAEVAGIYQYINHGRDTSSHIKESTNIELKQDGTILWEGDVCGGWELSSNGCIKLTIDGREYDGVVLKQWDNGLKKKVMVFTALSTENGVSIWGSKISN